MNKFTVSFAVIVSIHLLLVITQLNGLNINSNGEQIRVRRDAHAAADGNQHHFVFEPSFMGHIGKRDRFVFRDAQYQGPNQDDADDTWTYNSGLDKRNWRL
ncbi:unnamed protein product [Didymodactylos carnosus]|uniref:Uncharacterized protein n=1 Tax=Didymodactylos carnosus TaxID=1234261 RepID=A0A814D0M9_9BILA|nr:unnamed protein product [Didymodactylos carnosus]CAF1266978.1 unnamed protein product [Didymodactylos carnosus]CAF3724476.1 unnamed protein product [Didymodactylos carnosus]CAF4072917.1 unnamed protein product [Didymodactylos carnosus]